MDNLIEKNLETKLLQPEAILKCPKCASPFVADGACESCYFKFDYEVKDSVLAPGNYWELRADYLSTLNFLDYLSTRPLYFHRPAESDYLEALFGRYRKLLRLGEKTANALNYLEIKNIVHELGHYPDYQKKILKSLDEIENKLLMKKVEDWSARPISEPSLFFQILKQVISKKIVIACWSLLFLTLASLALYAYLLTF